MTASQKVLILIVVEDDLVPRLGYCEPNGAQGVLILIVVEDDLVLPANVMTGQPAQPS